MEDGRERLAHLLRGVGVEWVLFGLHRSPALLVGPAGEALGDEAPGSGFDRGLDHDVGGLGAEPVGLGEGLGEAPEVEVPGQCGHLMDYDLRLGVEDRPSHRLTVPAVEHHRGGAGKTQAVGLGRGPGRANHLVTGIDQQRHQTLPDGSGGAGYEDSHVVSFRLPTQDEMEAVSVTAPSGCHNRRDKLVPGT